MEYIELVNTSINKILVNINFYITYTKTLSFSKLMNIDKFFWQIIHIIQLVLRHFLIFQKAFIALFVRNDGWRVSKNIFLSKSFHLLYTNMAVCCICHFFELLWMCHLLQMTCQGIHAQTLGCGPSNMCLFHADATFHINLKNE